PPGCDVRSRRSAETGGLQGFSRIRPNACDRERTVSVAIVATRLRCEGDCHRRLHNSTTHIRLPLQRDKPVLHPTARDAVATPPAAAAAHRRPNSRPLAPAAAPAPRMA